MTYFLINLPGHKRWMLPDGKHQLDIQIYGDQENWRVIKSFPVPSTVLSGYLKLTDPNYERNHETMVALAEKKFRKRSAYEQAGGKP